MLRHFFVLIIIWNALWKTALLTSLPFLFDSNLWVLFLSITCAVHCPWTPLAPSNWSLLPVVAAWVSLPLPYLGLPRALAAKSHAGVLSCPLLCKSACWESPCALQVPDFFAAFSVWTYGMYSTEHHSGTSDNCMRTVCRRLAQPFCRWSTECLFVFCVLSSEFQSQCLEQSHLSYLLLFFVTCAVRCVSKLRNSFEKLSWKILRKPMFQFENFCLVW